MITHDDFETFLKDLLMNENYPDSILSFSIVTDPDQLKQTDSS